MDARRPDTLSFAGKSSPSSRSAPGAGSSRTERRFARNAGLDGLRAIAVAGVVYRHLHLPGLYGGGVGVFAFFTLSGFIITYLLCVELRETGRIALGAFWLRRALRLLPALLLTVLVSMVLGVTVGHQNAFVPLRESLPALGYFANWARVWTAYHPGAFYLGPFDHTWSLSVEEQFYLTWPLIFLALRTVVTRRPVLAVIITLILAEISGAVRFFAWDSAKPEFSANVLYNRTDTQAELLLIGAAAGIVAARLSARAAMHRGLPRWLLSVGGIAGLLILFLAMRFQPPPTYPTRMHAFWTVGLTLLALGVSALCLDLLLNVRGLVSRLLSIPPLPQLGRISYGIYLYHYPVLIYLGRRLSRDTYTSAALVTLITLAIATASWFLVERPVIRLGQRTAAARRTRRDVTDDRRVAHAAG
jgi:peptidoglycan/LPS O-acetylase OafA/YrhL